MMMSLLFFCILAPSVDTFIQFWGPMNGMYPGVQNFGNQMPMAPMMYFPRPSYPQPFFGRPMFQPQQMVQSPPSMFQPQQSMLQPQQSMLQTQPSMFQPQQLVLPAMSSNYPPSMNIPTTTPNSFLSIFDALSIILQREAQKAQFAKMQELSRPRYTNDRSNIIENVQISDPNDNGLPELSPGNTHKLSSLINSLPAPEIILLMNQFTRNRMSKHKTENPFVESFKIEKGHDDELPPSTPIEKESSEKVDDDSLIGLLRSGRWKTMNWKRKILGLDEIPTAEEGNALAQLFQEKKTR